MSLEGKEIFFDPENKRLPVPRYLYKIITNKTSGDKEVYVFTNNPYESLKTIYDEVDQQFGDKATELTGDYVKVTKGYTFKVPYDDFVKSVDIKFKDQTVTNHSIPLSQGEIAVIQHPTRLNVLQVTYEMPMTKDKVKGEVSF